MKFRTKVTFCMISLMSVLFGAGGSALISFSFQDALHQEEKSAKESYSMILNTLQIVNNMENWSTEQDVSQVLEQLSSQGASWSAIHLFSEDTSFYSQGEIVSSLQDLTAHTDSTHCAYTVLSLPDSAYYLQVSGSFSIGNTVLYLDVAYDISSIYATREQQLRTFIWIFLILISACAVFSCILSYFLTRPLIHLSKASKEIASGNYQCRSRIQTNDEVGSLSRDFDSMADHLLYHIDELNAAMERQNQFIGNFTHELKTPMTSIIGYADLLRSQTLSEEDALDAANYIFSEGKRLERLSMTLLDIFVADREKVTFSLISPAELIAELVLHRREAFVRQNIILEMECEEGTCYLEPDLVTSLLVNLLENARRSISGNGWIRITCRMTEEGCQITVADNGRGIPEDSLSHITEAFYRVDKSRSRAQGGAGLGLTLCIKIAELHNGAIHFESEEGIGTTVTAELKGGRV